MRSHWCLSLTLTLGCASMPREPEAREQPEVARLDPQTREQLRRSKEALDKYQDPIVAVRDGYFSTVGCVEYPEGGMGVHFFNVALLGPEPDPLRPPVLVYETDGERFRLVAAEWFVPLATGVRERPILFGQPMDGPMEGHFPLMPRELHHYDLHVWFWKDNPAGFFNPTNPDVKCKRADYAVYEQMPKHVPHVGVGGAGSSEEQVPH